MKREKTLALAAVLGSPLGMSLAAMTAPKVIFVLSGLTGLLLAGQALGAIAVILSILLGVPVALGITAIVAA